MAASRWMWAKLESHGIMQVMCCFFGISPYLLFCYVANVLQISDKQAHKKGIRNKNPINAKRGCAFYVSTQEKLEVFLLFF